MYIGCYVNRGRACESSIIGGGGVILEISHIVFEKAWYKFSELVESSIFSYEEDNCSDAVFNL